MKAAFKKEHDDEMDAFYGSARGIDDGIINPCDTRHVLGMCLSAICSAPIEKGFTVGLSRL